MRFNGIHYTEVNPNIKAVTLENTNQPISPSFTTRTLTRSGADGSVFYGKNRQAKEITVGLVCAVTSMAERSSLMRDIAEWLDVEEPKPLILDSEPDKQDMVVLTSEIVPSKQTAYLMTLRATFTNYLGYSENVDDTVVTTTPHTLGGTAECDFKAHITLNENAGSCVLRIDGKELILNEGLLVGDVVTFDSKLRRAEVNGIAFPVSVNTEWFKLPQGEFDIELEPLTSTFQIEYKARWK